MQFFTVYHNIKPFFSLVKCSKFRILSYGKEISSVVNKYTLHAKGNMSAKHLIL